MLHLACFLGGILGFLSGRIFCRRRRSLQRNLLRRWELTVSGYLIVCSDFSMFFRSTILFHSYRWPIYRCFTVSWFILFNGPFPLQRFRSYLLNNGPLPLQSVNLIRGVTGKTEWEYHGEYHATISWRLNCLGITEDGGLSINITGSIDWESKILDMD